MSNRTMAIQIAFRDSPMPSTYDNVLALLTEGGLLRIAYFTAEGQTVNEWFPLVNVYKITELARTVARAAPAPAPTPAEGSPNAEASQSTG